jgi:hypothetical protein
MTTILDEEKLLVVYEGQQHWVQQQIAQSDDLLRQLFGRLSPELAGAEIKREPGKIEIVPKKGSKGAVQPSVEQVLNELDTVLSAIDPAIVMCLALQRIELCEGINPGRAEALSQQIEAAIAQSQRWSASVQQTLKRLDETPSISTILVGF